MKRRSFLGALAAVFAAPKLLEAKSDPVQESIDLPWPHPWVAEHFENPASHLEPVTICPNCGRFRTKSRSRILILPPAAGVAMIGEDDYLPVPDSPRFVDGCLRCGDEKA